MEPLDMDIGGKLYRIKPLMEAGVVSFERHTAITHADTLTVAEAKKLSTFLLNAAEAVETFITDRRHQLGESDEKSTSKPRRKA